MGTKENFRREPREQKNRRKVLKKSRDKIKEEGTKGTKNWKDPLGTRC